MKVKLFWITFLISTLLASTTQAFTVVSKTRTSHDHHLRKTEWVVSVDSNPLNNFKAYRVKSNSNNVQFRGVLLVLPGLLSNFKAYEITDTGQYVDSFAGYFASRGFDVYGYSPPNGNITPGPGGCAPPNGTGTTDCSVMAGWGIARTISDVDFIRNKIANHHPGVKPAIGGLSMGTMQAIGVINAHPNDYAGLLMWEGTMAISDTAAIANNVTFCADDAFFLSVGLTGLGFIYDGQFAAFNGPHVDYVTFMSAPNPRLGGFTDFYSVIGDPLTPPGVGSFTFADETRLAGVITTQDGWAATKMFQDIDCSYAGSETSFTNNLANFDKPVLQLQAEFGFGTEMNAMFNLLGTDPGDVTTEFATGMGHADPFFTADHQTFVEEPILDWLENVIFP